MLCGEAGSLAGQVSKLITYKHVLEGPLRQPAVQEDGDEQVAKRCVAQLAGKS